MQSERSLSWLQGRVGQSALVEGEANRRPVHLSAVPWRRHRPGRSHPCRSRRWSCRCWERTGCSCTGRRGRSRRPRCRPWGALAGGAGRAGGAVLVGGALGLGSALVPLTDEPGLAVRVGGALLALPVDADLVVRLALLVRVALRIVGGHPVRTARPRTPSASTPKRRDMRTSVGGGHRPGQPDPCRPLYRHAVMAVKRNSRHSRLRGHILVARGPRPGVR
jgi:hypothetical protein